WQIPRFINTDKAPAYGRALALLKREGRCPSDVEHRQIKYRNNVIECDHGKLKRIIGATLGFKSMKTAYATIKGIEVMRALRKGQASAFYYGDPLGEMRLVREGANKQVISSQADSLIKISRIWADFFPANTSNQPI
ncbi:transposase, partial [Enterobacter cloacae]|uniref:transposase n=3 Tax=Enterobacterales TaxID=91347 RepID=UPI001FD7ABE0